MNRCKRFISKTKKATVMAVIIFLSVIAPVVMVTGDVAMGSELSVFTNASQAKINRLKAEKSEFERQKSEIQEKIDASEFELTDALEKKGILDQRIVITGMELNNIINIIDEYHLLIRENEYEVYLAREREESQLQRYRNRVRYMEENGYISYLDILLNSTSFSDLLARIDFIGEIIRSDEKMYNDLQIAKTETESAREELEESKAELEIEKEKLEEMKIELDLHLDEANLFIQKLRDNIETDLVLYEQMVEEEEKIQNEINAALTELQRQRRAAARQQNRTQRQATGSTNTGTTANTSGDDTTGGGSSGTGQFMWPISGQLWSGFGMRNGRLHGGIDIGAPHGATVVAADSGTVITATNGYSYGNYVSIAHGNGLTTLYAHLSVISVNKGDYVSRGQKIGENGSTGNSTAPHVHFEVYENGKRVDPRPYLP